jgi:hypothetical protein
MSAPVNVLAAALHGHKLTKRETKRAAMFLGLFLKLSDQDKVSILQLMQAFALVGGKDAPSPGVQVAALLDAEREAVSKLWTILHELRLADALPAWALALDSGTTGQHAALERAREQLDKALADAVPGFVPARRRDLSNVQSWTL